MVERGLGHDGRMVWLRRVRSLRSRSVLVLVVVAATVVSACDHGADALVEEPRTRLLALENLWFASPATITYRTTERDPGEATSPHQCLRQLVEVDVQTGLRICSGVGEMRLVVGPARPMADGRGLPGRRLHTALYPRWRRSLSGDRGCSVHLFRHRDERTVRVGGRSPRAHPRRTRRFRRIGGVRRTQADDRGYPCRVLQCDRRFGGDVSPSGVVLLAERTLALSLRWGRRRSRDDGRGYRRIGGRVRRRLRRAVHLM